MGLRSGPSLSPPAIPRKEDCAESVQTPDWEHNIRWMNDFELADLGSPQTHAWRVKHRLETHQGRLEPLFDQAFIKRSIYKARASLERQRVKNASASMGRRNSICA